MVPLRPLAERSTEMGTPRTPRWRRHAGTALTVAVIGGAVGWLIYDAIRTGQIAQPPASFWAFATMCVILMIANAWIGRRCVTQLPQPLLVATSLAAGRCGCCGSALRDVSPDEDGRVTCPACTAAWHSDRWAQGRVDVSHVHLAVRQAHDGVRMDPRDHRGVAIDPNAFSREKWTGPNLLAEMNAPKVVPTARERRDMARRDMDRVRERSMVRAVGLGLAACGLCAGVHALMHWAFGTSMTPASWAVYCGVFVAIVMHGSANRNLSFQRAALKQGLCPNCGVVLSESARIEFDGCVSCTHCARAWRAAEVQRPMVPSTTTSSVANSFAYRFGHAISGGGHGNG